jgi:hypothetical protein
MFGRVVMRLAGWTRARELALTAAASAKSRQRILAAPDRDEERFDAVMASRARQPHVVLGRVVGREGEKLYLFSVTDFRGLFGWLTGGTGSGKSRTVGSFLNALAAPLITLEDS